MDASAASKKCGFCANILALSCKLLFIFALVSKIVFGGKNGKIMKLWTKASRSVKEVTKLMAATIKAKGKEMAAMRKGKGIKSSSKPPRSLSKKMQRLCLQNMNFLWKWFPALVQQALNFLH